MGAEKTQARDRAEAIVDMSGGFCSSLPPTFPKLNTVQEPQQTLLPRMDAYYVITQEVGRGEGLKGLWKVYLFWRTNNLEC